MTKADAKKKLLRWRGSRVEEEIEEREFRLEYGVLQPEFWLELNDWRQKALEQVGGTGQ